MELRADPDRQSRLGGAAVELPQLTGSTLDPRNTQVAWAAWQVSVPPRLTQTFGTRPFAELAEALWDPDQPTVLISQLEGTGDGRVTASVALGICGPDDVERERDAAAIALVRDLAGLRVRVHELSGPPPVRAAWAAAIRPRTLTVDGHDVPSRFTRFANTFTLLADVLRQLDDPVTVRVSHVTTSTTADERAQLDAMARSYDSSGGPAVSPSATATDLLARLSGIAYVREVLVAGPGAVPAKVALRRLACCMTSTLGTVWTENGPECHHGEIPLGGFVLEPRDPATVAAASDLGLPGTVFDRRRGLVDLVSLDGLLWGIPCPSGEVPGLSATPA